jgi:hypothetical protein
MDASGRMMRIVRSKPRLTELTRLDGNQIPALANMRVEADGRLFNVKLLAGPSQSVTSWRWNGP